MSVFTGGVWSLWTSLVCALRVCSPATRTTASRIDSLDATRMCVPFSYGRRRQIPKRRSRCFTLDSGHRADVVICCQAPIAEIAQGRLQ